LNNVKLNNSGYKTYGNLYNNTQKEENNSLNFQKGISQNNIN